MIMKISDNDRHQLSYDESTKYALQPPWIIRICQLGYIFCFGIDNDNAASFGACGNKEITYFGII